MSEERVLRGYWRGKIPVYEGRKEEAWLTLQQVIELCDNYAVNGKLQLASGHINLLERNGLLGSPQSEPVTELHNLKYFSTVRNVFNNEV